MKNLLWMLLGAVIGLMATYKYLEGYAGKEFLQKAIANYEARTEEGQIVSISPLILTSPIDTADAKRIIKNYRASSPYSLQLIKGENRKAIESWVIDLNVVRNHYQTDSLAGLRVYLAEHRDKDNKRFNSLVVAGVQNGPTQGTYNNIIGPGNRVLQYVLPCPDNCDSSVNGLGLEK